MTYQEIVEDVLLKLRERVDELQKKLVSNAKKNVHTNESKAVPFTKKELEKWVKYIERKVKEAAKAKEQEEVKPDGDDEALRLMEDFLGTGNSESTPAPISEDIRPEHKKELVKEELLEDDRIGEVLFYTREFNGFERRGYVVLAGRLNSHQVKVAVGLDDVGNKYRADYTYLDKDFRKANDKDAESFLNSIPADVKKKFVETYPEIAQKLGVNIE